MVEQFAVNEKVAGSNPASGAKIFTSVIFDTPKRT